MEVNDLLNIPIIPQPKSLNINLFRHQLASIHRLEEFEVKKQVDIARNIHLQTSLGINANPTGSGKTLEMIGLIVRNRMEWDLSQPFQKIRHVQYSDLLMHQQVQYFFRLPTTLILVGQSIIRQWEQEFKYTHLKVRVISTNKDALNVDPYLYDVILITPTMFNAFVMRFTEYAWKRFIYDEPGQIHVPRMKSVTAGFYWFVTATPFSIFYRSRYSRSNFLRDVFYSLYYHDTYINLLSIRNSTDFIRMSFQLPPVEYRTHNCYESVFNRVHGLVPEHVLEMISAGNINGAIQALGGKKTDNIVELIKTRKLQDLEIAEAKVRIYRNQPESERYRKWKDRKERLEGQIRDLEQRFKDELEGNCSVCISPLVNPILEPACQQLFCTECLLTWLQRSKKCPMCRSEVTLNELIYINTDPNVKSPKNSEGGEDKKTKNKVETIIDIVKGTPNGKFIIFSAWDQTFSIIRNALGDHSIPFVEIKGRVESRENKLNNFRSGQIPVIFLNSKHNGAGINLQEATDIILYHDMDENVETQVVGRANRIGRTGSLVVHRLVNVMAEG